MHWGMGLSVLGCFAFVQAAQQVNPKDPAKKQFMGMGKGDLMFYHKSFGTLAAGLLVPRLVVRAISKNPPSFSKMMFEKVIADVSHGIMYGMLIVMPVTGVAMGYYGGKGLPFFTTTIPGAGPEDKDGKLAGQAFKLHKQIGWYMELLFLGHLGGVAGHTIRGHPILARIVPGLK